MIQFLLFAALALGAVAVLVAPLVRRPRPVAARSAYDLEVYRAQLAELERDAARGVIGAESRDAARREIERRVLALDQVPERAAPAVGPSRFVAAVVIAVVVPVAAGALYLALGAPTLADRPLAERSAETAASATDGAAIEDMVAGLATRLQSEPDNLEGWVLLARSYGALGRYDEAVTALRRVVELSGEPGTTAMLAEYMVFAADGIVTPDALALFDQVAAAAPDDAAAAFYRGLAREQSGDTPGALEHWTALGRASAPDAPWLPSLRQRIAAAAVALGRDAETELAGIPEPAAGATMEQGPTDEDVAAAADMAAEDQQAMIQGMVEGLAERLRSEPDDVEGWLKLANAYRVLGEAVKARDAYAAAALASPDDPALLAAYAEAMTEAAPAGVLPDAAHLIWRRVLDLDAGNAAALWALGQAAALGGKAEVARELLTRLRDLLPEGSDERARVEHELDRLPAG